jgi:hypothetical protein
VIIAGFLVFNALFVQIRYAHSQESLFLYRPAAADFARYQQFHPLFEWLNTHTERDDVILADNELSYLIPCYTHNNVYICWFAQIGFVSEEELRRRWFSAFALFGTSPQQVKAAVLSTPMYFRYHRPPPGQALEEMASQWEAHYREFLKENTPWMAGRDFRLDYVITLPSEATRFAGNVIACQLQEYPFLREVYDHQGAKIYQVIR